MNEIVKEELWRSIGVFFLALIFVSLLITKIEYRKVGFFILFGIPILITIIFFLVMVYIRRNEVYKPRKWSLERIIKILAFICILDIIFAFMGYNLYGKISPIIIIGFIICFILLFVLIICYFLRKKK